MRAAVVVVVGVVASTRVVAQPSPADMIMSSPGWMPLQTSPRIPPMAIEKLLPVVPYLDPVAEYAQAWHTLSVGASQAARDLARVAEQIATTVDIVKSHRSDMAAAAPWLLRLVLQRGLGF